MKKEFDAKEIIPEIASKLRKEDSEVKAYAESD